MKKLKFSHFPWFAFLLSIYPVLALLGHNIGEVSMKDANRAITISFIVSILIFTILSRLLSDHQKAGLMLALAYLIFFSYGHVYSLIKNFEIGGILIGRHRFLFALWVALLSLGLWWIWKKSVIIPTLTTTLNVLAIGLMILPVYQIGAYQINTSINQNAYHPDSVVDVPVTGPDVYFIILDMYGRSDTLLNNFDYDNSEFIKQLHALGFYVASCANSNYQGTLYSLSATMNMKYLDTLEVSITPESTDVTPLWGTIQNSSVATTFKKLEYTTIAFETGYYWGEFHAADIFYTLNTNKMNAFEGLLMRTSAALALEDYGLFKNIKITSDERKYALVQFVLEKLTNIPDLPGSKYVFVHIVVPHPAFVFGPSGEFLVVPPHYEDGEDYYPKADYISGYTNQVEFINQAILTVIAEILKKSSEPPIIILQGDHGPRYVDEAGQLSILSAYYFPNPKPILYDSITPVNNFRMIFSTYFGADLPNLPDHSFYYNQDKPFIFHEVANDCSVVK